MTPPPVVDAHTHLLPGRLAEKVRAFFAPIAGQLVYPLDHGIVRERLAGEGIDEIWNLPYAHKPGVADGLNESSRVIAAQPGPLTVVGGATVHPGDDRPADIVRRAVEELGLRVLKLHCSVGDFDADDPGLDDVWKLAVRGRAAGRGPRRPCPDRADRRLRAGSGRGRRPPPP